MHDKIYDFKEMMNSLKEENLNESQLDHYLGSEYDDYKYGDPAAAATDLKALLKKIEKDMASARKLAGKALAPGIMAAFKKDIMKIKGLK